MPARSFLHARWRHAPAGSPLEIFCELDDARRETRKVEVFAGDRWHWAGPDGTSHGQTELAEIALPTLAEIQRDIAFDAREITAAMFEAAWVRARG